VYPYACGCPYGGMNAGGAAVNINGAWVSIIKIKYIKTLIKKN
jgi:hypothetical protein